MRGVGMGKCKSPSTIALEVATEGTGSGSASDEEVVVISPTWFPPRRTRPQGSKATKADVVAQKKRDKILQSQVRAIETMAEVSLHKANAIQDQCAMSFFTMPLEEDMSEEAKNYFTFHRQEEIQGMEQSMQAERRRAELEELEHAKLGKERNLEEPLQGTASLQHPPRPWLRLHLADHPGLYRCKYGRDSPRISRVCKIKPKPDSRLCIVHFAFCMRLLIVDLCVEDVFF